MKKIYYIPGIFSIILLPILSIWYMNKYDYFTKLSAHAVIFMDFEEADRSNEEIGTDIFFSDKSVKRIYKEVHLNNDKNSKKIFNYIDQFVNDVVQTKDTIYGLKIHFEENATYNEFIEVLNIFNERNAEIYTLDKNTMYFVGRDWKSTLDEDENEEANGGGMPSPNLDHLECGLVLAGNYNEENTNLNSFLNNLKTQFSQNKIIYSAYTIFFLITIVSIILKNKKLPK